jgi:hypothetical protein
MDLNIGAVKHDHEHRISHHTSPADAGIPHVFWFGDPVLPKEVNVHSPTDSRRWVSDRCRALSSVRGTSPVSLDALGAQE